MATVEVTAENREACLCPGCPTYNECMTAENENLYCGVGKTVCEPTKSGCLCPGCPVHEEYGLVGTYYCFSGPAA